MAGTRYKVVVELVEPMLGAIALDPKVFEENSSGANAPTIEAMNEEMEGLPEEPITKGLTGFFKKDGKILEYDYVVKGFFKGACGMLRRVPGSLSSKVTSYKKFIDGLVFVYPRQIVIHVPDGIDIDNLEVFTRALRASTAQGDRVALASSEVCPVGSWLEFEVETLTDCEPLLREWLEYGSKWGLRQWRNAGYGRFSYVMEKIG